MDGLGGGRGGGGDDTFGFPFFDDCLVWVIASLDWERCCLLVPPEASEDRDEEDEEEEWKREVGMRLRSGLRLGVDDGGCVVTGIRAVDGCCGGGCIAAAAVLVPEADMGFVEAVASTEAARSRIVLANEWSFAPAVLSCGAAARAVDEEVESAGAGSRTKGVGIACW